MLPLGWLGPHVCAISWFVTRREHHGMNRCLRSLSCFLTVSTLALFATDASARTNPKPPPPKKTQDAKKPPHARPEVRPQRTAVAEKRRPVKRTDAKKKSKQAKNAPAPKNTAKETAKETAKQAAPSL